MLFHDIQQFGSVFVIHFADALIDACIDMQVYFTWKKQDIIQKWLLACHILARLHRSRRPFCNSDGVSPYTNKNISVKTNVLQTCKLINKARQAINKIVI